MALSAVNLQYISFTGDNCLSYVHIDRFKDKYIDIFMLN